MVQECGHGRSAALDGYLYFHGHGSEQKDKTENVPAGSSVEVREGLPHLTPLAAPASTRKKIMGRVIRCGWVRVRVIIHRPLHALCAPTTNQVRHHIGHQTYRLQNRAVQPHLDLCGGSWRTMACIAIFRPFSHLLVISQYFKTSPHSHHYGYSMGRKAVTPDISIHHTTHDHNTPTPIVSPF